MLAVSTRGCLCTYRYQELKKGTPDQHAAHRTRHVVTLYYEMFCTVSGQFPEHLVTRYVPIATFLTFWTDGQRIICPMLCITHPTMSSLYVAHSKISICCTLVGEAASSYLNHVRSLPQCLTADVANIGRDSLWYVHLEVEGGEVGGKRKKKPIYFSQ